MKFQLVPIVVVAALVLVAIALRPVLRWKALDGTSRSSLGRRALVLIVCLPIVFATPIKNAAVHHNPVWPVELKVLGHSFPHLQEAYSSSPAHLENASRPVRFFRSVFEIDNAAISTQRRWSLDQWAPSSDPACRMGGFFGAYVAVNLVAIAWIVWRGGRREAKHAVALFCAVTLVASLVPQSHELRYYMHWMLLLVCLNLVLWTGSRERRLVGLVAALALGIVTWSTGGGYLYASGTAFRDFVPKRTEAAVIDAASPGEHLCIAREPFTFLYAPTFHARKDYAVQEATSDHDCQGHRLIQ
jgi:hypothetical protein